MNRRFTISVLLFTLLLAGLMAPMAFASPNHPWANQVIAKLTSNVNSPQQALHAPDGQYAQIGIKGSILTLDMGKNEEGFGDLMIYHDGLGLGFPTPIKVEFLDQNFNSFYSTQALLAAGVGPKTTLVNFDPTSSDTGYRYVRFGFAEKTILLDAVEIMMGTSEQ